MFNELQGQVKVYGKGSKVLPLSTSILEWISIGKCRVPTEGGAGRKGRNLNDFPFPGNPACLSPPDGVTGKLPAGISTLNPSGRGWGNPR
jgi:hypothetical protein